MSTETHRGIANTHALCLPHLSQSPGKHSNALRWEHGSFFEIIDLKHGSFMKPDIKMNNIQGIQERSCEYKVRNIYTPWTGRRTDQSVIDEIKSTTPLQELIKKQQLSSSL